MPDDAVEEPVEGPKQDDSEGALPLSRPEIVAYSLFWAVDLLSYRDMILKTGFFYRLHVRVRVRVHAPTTKWAGCSRVPLDPIIRGGKIFLKIIWWHQEHKKWPWKARPLICQLNNRLLMTYSRRLWWSLKPQPQKPMRWCSSILISTVLVSPLWIEIHHCHWRCHNFLNLVILAKQIQMLIAWVAQQ